MIYPKLVRHPQQLVTVTIGEPELNEDGELVGGHPQELKCYLQLKAYEKLTADKRLLTLSGKALFDGDICPELPQISSGTLAYNGAVYTIHAGQRNYNPDGSINYTTLELI